MSSSDTTPGQGDQRPNVIVLVTDDQGYGDLGCHGNPVLETPNMDQLHDEAARLDQFHVGTTCAPSRASLMTGRHKLRTGVWHTVNGWSLLDREETTMAEFFSRAGYETGMFGKWHLGDNYPYRPQDRGFDETFIHGGGGVSQTPDYWGNDYFDDTYFHNGEPEAVEGYCTDVWFREATEFITRCADADRPFFCYLPTNAPHGPTEVPDPYRESYAGEVHEQLARFYGMIENIDDNLGELRAHLREIGVADDTILVFMGDNGTIGAAAEQYNAGMRGNKGSEYDGGHRVQCFVHWPDRIEEEAIETLTRHYDILPTLADYCGLDCSSVRLDGRSLRPLFADEANDWPTRTLVVDTQRVEQPRKWKSSSVMTDRWRLVNRDELYDINADPGQTNDVSGEHPDVVERLREEYESWWADASGEVDGYCRIPVGTDAADPVTLTAHDWHECQTVPWTQTQILSGIKTNGFWTLEVRKPGTYRIELRRWPREAEATIDGVPDGYERLDYGARDFWTAEAERVDPTEASIEIGGVTRTKPVPEGDRAVSFRVELSEGPAELATEFDLPEQDNLGSYYAYVGRV